jgi:hypothetical protein
MLSTWGRGPGRGALRAPAPDTQACKLRVACWVYDFGRAGCCERAARAVRSCCSHGRASLRCTVPYSPPHPMTCCFSTLAACALAPPAWARTRAPVQRAAAPGPPERRSMRRQPACLRLCPP